MKKIIISAQLCLVLISTLQAKINFIRHDINTDLPSAYWVHAVDMDGDGDLDLVSGANWGVDWWENSGAGSFSRHDVGYLEGVWSVHAADYDNDGDVDVVAAAPASQQVVLWERNGTKFKEIIIEENVSGVETVYFADLDNDGDQDIISAHWVNREMVWYENRGGSFRKNVLDDNIEGAHSLYAADFDRDGDPDVVGIGGNKTRWYRNNGNGSFDINLLSNDGGLSVFAADLDHDGDLDFLRTERDYGNIEWFRNDGNGSFQLRTIEDGFSNSWCVTAGDIDGDGDLDVASAGFLKDQIKIWLNDGAGNFDDGQVVETVTRPRFVYIADLDDDGDGDIAAAIRDDKDLVWYEVPGSPKSITVTSPAGGDTLVAESTFELKWQWTSSVAKVDIEFSTDNKESWQTLVNGLPNTGRYNWQVPAISTRKCFIRISETGNAQVTDVNDAPFFILTNEELPPTVTVLQPNGGEVLFVDSLAQVNWQTTGPITQVKIELSANGGAAWSLVTEMVNDGEYDWTAADSLSQACLIRISDAANANTVDISDSVFTITLPPQQIVLKSPIGGESLREGNEFEIAWRTGGVIDSVKIEFSADNGLSWIALANSTENDGSYDWLVPDTLSSLCLIIISDAKDGKPFAVSKANFTIRTIASFIPKITAFVPPAAAPGAPVLVLGENFVIVLDVAFSNKSTPFTVVAENQIQTTVPFGIPSGTVKITNFAGSGESAGQFKISAGVDSALVTAHPTDDAFVDGSAPTVNFGADTLLMVSSGNYISFLKFKVDSLSGEIVSARLRLRIEHGENAGVKIFSTQSFWTENDVTAANAPIIIGAAIDSLDSTEIAGLAEFDLTPIVRAAGSCSFAITGTSPDILFFSSKESASLPELILAVATEGNVAPYAESDSVEVREDVQALFTILPNDLDPDGQLDNSSIEIVTAPVNGTAISSASGSMVYAPKPNYSGSDSLFYTVTDTRGAKSNIARVWFTILPVNDAPAALPDTAVMQQAGSLTINALANDFDVDSEIEPKSIQIVDKPVSKTIVTFDTTGIISYKPHWTFSGLDSFSYKVADDVGDFSKKAFVKITVTPVNQPPVAVNDSVKARQGKAVDIDVLANDWDLENQLNFASVTLVTLPLHGQAFVRSLTGIIFYRPVNDFLGTDSLAYFVSDLQGMNSGIARVFISVRKANNRPAIISHVPEQLQLEYPIGDSLLFSINTSDPDADPLHFSWMLRGDSNQLSALVSSDSFFVLQTKNYTPQAYSVTAKVSDGEAVDSLQWQIDLVTSVELTSMQAGFVEFAGVKIQWTTAHEIGHAGFKLLRSLSRNGVNKQINAILIKPEASGNYTITDPDVEAGRKYFYTLESVDINGKTFRYSPLQVEITKPESFSLSQNYPNPFNPETKIRYQLPEKNRVVIRIYNILGHAVRTLLDAEKLAGFYVVTWDGRNDFGLQVGSGIYYYQISAGEYRETRKMLLVR